MSSRKRRGSSDVSKKTSKSKKAATKKCVSKCKEEGGEETTKRTRSSRRDAVTPAFGGVKRLVHETVNLRVSAQAVEQLISVIREIASNLITESLRFAQIGQRSTLLYKDLEAVLLAKGKFDLPPKATIEEYGSSRSAKRGASSSKEEKSTSQKGKSRQKESKGRSKNKPLGSFYLQSMTFRRLVESMTNLRISQAFLKALQYCVEKKIILIIQSAAQLTHQIEDKQTISAREVSFVYQKKCF